jgi:hypothetical protein
VAVWNCGSKDVKLPSSRKGTSGPDPDKIVLRGGMLALRRRCIRLENSDRATNSAERLLKTARTEDCGLDLAVFRRRFLPTGSKMALCRNRREPRIHRAGFSST